MGISDEIATIANLVPRAFSLKNGWKSPGDEVGGDRIAISVSLATLVAQ